MFNNEVATFQQSVNINLQSRLNKKDLLEYYLRTYNPLQIDLTTTNERNSRISIVKDPSCEETSIETDTRPIVNCYSFNCTNKGKIDYGNRYTRLKEQDNCSTTMNTIDDRLSECSTKLTCITFPTVMITDCSNSQQLYTHVIELNKDEKDN